MPHFYGAVGAPILGGHQWQPHSKRPLVIGDGRGSREALLLLQRLRRGDPAPEYGLRAMAAALTVLVHALVVFLVAVHAPGYAPPADLQELMASTEVRIIEVEEPPPPPPPVELPKRPQPRKAAPPPLPVKEAPEAAMPSIPQVAQAVPEVRVENTMPEVSPVLEMPAPAPRAAASPPTDVPVPDIEIATDLPRLVPEPSDMALPAPRVQGDHAVARVEAPETPMQPVPTLRERPQVDLGRPDLDVSGTLDLPRPTVVRTVPEAATPDVPAARLAAPEVSVTPDQARVRVEPVTVQPVQMPSATLTPIPESPASRTSPRFDLPVAAVPEPQAPRVEMPALHAEMTVPAPQTPAPATTTTTAEAVASAERAGPATSESARAADAGESAADASRNDSWLPADDRFQPATGDGAGASGTGDARDGKKGYVQLEPRGNSDVMQRSSDRLGYTPTIFEQYWAPDNESLLDTMLRRFVEKLSFKHTFHLAPGVRVHCVVGPLAIFIGCGGDPPRGVSSKSGDERLNMAPANPLVPGMGTQAPATNRSAPEVQVDNDINCTMARVAGSPPPPGCDKAPATPSRSDRWDGG